MLLLFYYARRHCRISKNASVNHPQRFGFDEEEVKRQTLTPVNCIHEYDIIKTRCALLDIIHAYEIMTSHCDGGRPKSFVPIKNPRRRHPFLRLLMLLLLLLQ
jgi:hypothetical protein